MHIRPTNGKRDYTLTDIDIYLQSQLSVNLYKSMNLFFLLFKQTRGNSYINII